MRYQQGIVHFRRHHLEMRAGDSSDKVDFERVCDRQLRLFLEICMIGNGVNPDRIILQEGREDEEFPEFRSDTFRYIFVRKSEEVIQQTQIFDSGGIDWVYELEEGIEDVGGVRDIDNIETLGILRSMAGWLRKREHVAEEG